MTLQRITTLSLFATLSLFSGGCDLGEKSIGNDTGADNGTGDGDGDDGNEQPAFGSCGDETITVITDTTAALAEFDGVAFDYLGMIEGNFAGTFDWLPPDGPVTIEHAGTSSPLMVTATYDGGEIRLVEVEDVGEFPDGNIESELCSNVLEIDVTLGFVTADGLFAESLPVTVRVLSHSEQQLPSFSFGLDMDALQGQLSLDDFEFPDGEITELVLGGQFNAETVSGGLNIEIRTMEWVGFGSIAGYDAALVP